MPALGRLRGARHLAVAAITLVIAATALPIPPVEAVGKRVEPVARLTHLSQGWQVFAPNVRSAARWTEVVAYHDEGTVERWFVEQDRNLLVGFRGIRFRKFAEQLRKSCRVARSYAEVVLSEPGVVMVELYRVLEEYEDGASEGVVKEQERMMKAWTDERGEVQVDRTGCGE